jgi:hypothetical protein
MSYIKINIGGKERGLKFNQMTLHVMAKYVDENEQELTSSYALIYAGLYCNSYQKREELDLTFEQVCDEVDKLKEEDIIAIQKAFQEEFNFAKEEPKEVKKKVVKVKKTT